MAASTNLIADMTTVVSDGPDSTTQANAIAAAGPIQDYVGNAAGALLKLQEADVALLAMLGIIDSSDGIKSGLTAIQHALTGAGSPSSTLLTDIQTAITAGPSVATQTRAIAPQGEIMDFVGMLHRVKRALQEAEVVIGYMITVTHTGADKTLLQNINLALT